MHGESLGPPPKFEAKGKHPLQTKAKSFPSYLGGSLPSSQRDESGFALVSPPGNSEARGGWVADLALVLATKHRSFLGTPSPSADSAFESSPSLLRPAAHSLPLNHPSSWSLLPPLLPQGGPTGLFPTATWSQVNASVRRLRLLNVSSFKPDSVWHLTRAQ